MAQSCRKASSRASAPICRPARLRLKFARSSVDATPVRRGGPPIGIRTMLKLLVGALSALVLLGLPIAANAAAGTAKGVDPLADALAAGQTRTLVVGSDINIGDTIKTGDKGQVQILFADNTKLVVGPNSSLEIQDYLIRNNGSAGKIAVDMLAGSFRFVTGT